MTANKHRTQIHSSYHDLSISEWSVDGGACRPYHDASDLTITSPYDSFQKKVPVQNVLPAHCAVAEEHDFMYPTHKLAANLNVLRVLCATKSTASRAGQACYFTYKQACACKQVYTCTRAICACVSPRPFRKRTHERGFLIVRGTRVKAPDSRNGIPSSRSNNDL